jgi:hypothetical protein
MTGFIFPVTVDSIRDLIAFSRVLNSKIRIGELKRSIIWEPGNGSQAFFGSWYGQIPQFSWVADRLFCTIPLKVDYYRRNLPSGENQLLVNSLRGMRSY